MTVLNPWQWYCSTRTFSNSLETTLTIAALCYWPWELLGDAKASGEAPLQQRGRVARWVSGVLIKVMQTERVWADLRDRDSLRISLVLAAVAVLLRPTNLLIWLTVLVLSLTRLALLETSPLRKSTLLVLFREIVVCGSLVLAFSLVSDRLYFGFWTFPPYKWLYFNISQSLAVFYGRMPWHYYLSQGVPLLTTTFLPFCLVGLCKTTSSKHPSDQQSKILRTLSAAVLAMITALSVISHKEVRFIYPLLPILHILAAPYITSFFTKPASATSNQPASSSRPQRGPVTLRHKITLAHILSLNILLAGYLSLFHQPAPLSVLTFLRTDFERLHPDALALGKNLTEKGPDKELFALFLTPCHSTPWRSHLVYPALRARALTCEPPLHTAPGSPERATYLDEADRFYQRDPAANGAYGVRFLAEEMWPARAAQSGGDDDNNEETGSEARPKRTGEIPRYIVGFEGIEEVLKAFFEGEDAPGRGMGVKLMRVWSAWNGAFNEDWRRRGRLVVWDTGVYRGSYREDVEVRAGDEL